MRTKYGTPANSPADNPNAAKTTSGATTIPGLAGCDVEVPWGFCHGDINFGNMIVDPMKQELYLFDFLDSFIESPLQDFSSLRQDFAFGWFTVKKKFSERDLLR